MEIIHLILGKANPERMNGVNKVVFELASKQTTQGHNVQVWGITQNPEHDYPPRNFSTRLFLASRNPFAMSRKLSEAIAQKKGKAVFHIHGGFIPLFYSAALWMKKNNIRFVFTPHGSYNTIARRKSSLRKKIYTILFERKLLEAASVVHCIGQSEIHGLHEVMPGKEAALLPYGFEAADECAPRYEQHADFIVGFCGRIDVYTKGLDALIDGFAEFAKNNNRTQLWIIGDGAELERLREMTVSHGIQHKVKLWGSRFGNDKTALLKYISVFAHPSRNEGLPASVLEAASLGVPCLISEATNLAEAVQNYHAGEVIHSTSASEVEQALCKIYGEVQNGKMPALRYGARQMIRQAFSWERIIPEFQQLYLKAWKAI
ncbi:MAG: glycosyltransferase family 4 protein [Bacteroidetes bacterium]|nr:glycosyltransferase family 4 protein [Bacteroidota bacterium]